MREGAIPAATLCAALGFAVSFVPRSALLPVALALFAAAGTTSLIAIDRAWMDLVFLGCWVSVVLTAAAVHWPRGIGRQASTALAANAGFWSAGVVGVAGTPSDLAKAIPLVLLFLPSMWLLRHKGAVVIKVAASWLVAVSILAGALSFAPVTPGYEPDHLE